MIATYVDPCKTPLTFDAARASLKWAIESTQSSALTVEGLALCLAKSALETGRWTKIWNFNFGNVKAGESYAGNFTCITLNEVLRRGGRDVVVWFAPEGELVGKPGSALKGPPIPVPDGHPQTRMRAHFNEYDGASQYADFLVSRYAPALACMVSGDAAGYVHTLKVLRYFTADEGEYLRGVVSLQREFIAKLKGIPHEETPISSALFDHAEFLFKRWIDGAAHDPEIFRAGNIDQGRE